MDNNIIEKLNDLKNDLKKFNKDYYESEGSEAVYEYIQEKIKDIDKIIDICKK